MCSEFTRHTIEQTKMVIQERRDANKRLTLLRWHSQLIAVDYGAASAHAPGEWKILSAQSWPLQIRRPRWVPQICHPSHNPSVIHMLWAQSCTARKGSPSHRPELAVPNQATAVGPPGLLPMKAPSSHPHALGLYMHCKEKTSF